MYENGMGVPQDDAMAAAWYHRAAEQGYAIAQNDLGLMYSNGRGVPEDHAEAAHWIRKAAEQGDALSQHNLGVIYAKGQGVSQDYVQAYAWLDLAREGGIEEAREAQNKLLPFMTSDQVAEAQKLSRELDAQIRTR